MDGREEAALLFEQSEIVQGKPSEIPLKIMALARHLNAVDEDLQTLFKELRDRNWRF
jgi:hypothetical protein